MLQPSFGTQCVDDVPAPVHSPKTGQLTNARMPTATNHNLADPLAEARDRLFPPLRNRILAQASAALREGDIAAAEPAVSKYLEKHPKDTDALNLKAGILQRLGDLSQAERLLSQCIDRPACKFNYAVILRRQGKLDTALVHLDELLRDHPQNALFSDQKAKVLREIGKHAEALIIRRALTQDFPNSVEFWLRYGDSLRGAGSQDDSIAAYQKVIELEPSLTGAYMRLSDLKVYRFTNTDIEKMEAQLARYALSTDDRANIHFALGKAYGQQTLHSKAFQHYAKANALRRLNLDADPERLTTHRRNCEQLFTKSFFETRKRWGCTTRGPIFIVGMPRSGSSLVEQILSSHSAIEGLEELSALSDVVVSQISRKARDSERGGLVNPAFLESKNEDLHGYPRVFEQLDEDAFRSMGEEYLNLIQGRLLPGSHYFTDKTLSNFGHVGPIHVMLPNARIIDVRRFPLDCGWSCFTNHFPSGMHFSYKLSDIGHHYVNYAKLMAHFDRALPGVIYRVTYEDLIADPESEVRRLLDYLELPFEDGCMRFHENKRVVTTLSSEQVRLPLYKSGIAQWQPYEPWLGPLKSALGPILSNYPNVPD